MQVQGVSRLHMSVLGRQCRMLSQGHAVLASSNFQALPLAQWYQIICWAVAQGM